MTAQTVTLRFNSADELRRVCERALLLANAHMVRLKSHPSHDGAVSVSDAVATLHDGLKDALIEHAEACDAESLLERLERENPGL